MTDQKELKEQYVVSCTYDRDTKDYNNVTINGMEVPEEYYTVENSFLELNSSAEEVYKEIKEKIRDKKFLQNKKVVAYVKSFIDEMKECED